MKCIFLGYSSNQKGYKCYSPITKRFYNSMDVTFFEQQPYYSKPAIQGENITKEYQLWDNTSSEIPTISTTLDSSTFHQSPRPLTINCDSLPHIEPSTPLPNDLIEPSTPFPSTPQITPAKNNEIRVYSRRNKTQGEIENRTHPEQVQESKPSSSFHDKS